MLFVVVAVWADMLVAVVVTDTGQLHLLVAACSFALSYLVVVVVVVVVVATVAAVAWRHRY